MEEYNNNTNIVKYFIANSNEVIHSGELLPDQQVSTGLDNLEIFDSEEEMNNRLIQLNND